MARILVEVDRRPLVREMDALTRRMQACDHIRAKVVQLAMQGVSTVEVVSMPARRGKAHLRQQLSDPYWAILESEAA